MNKDHWGGVDDALTMTKLWHIHKGASYDALELLINGDVPVRQSSSLSS